MNPSVQTLDSESDRRFRAALHQIDRLAPQERVAAMSAFLACTTAALNLVEMRTLQAELVKEFGLAWEFIPHLAGDIALREAAELAGA